ncbi:uncharacterized protein LOC120014146 [Tripterygium wilfordii]|uniref:uncharacterized protein LOC120014146 n=1 Tax=Tripterygium wilfordii TaxID=458696 RepID=UPI0018F82F8F|nr:uncharacterized protein LOC120014146 [Tripterygium wilfordii]
MVSKTALKARKKIGFVDGTLKTPDEADPSYQDWIQVDSLVKTWITNCVSPDIMVSVSTARKSHELWTYLKNRYSAANPTRDFELTHAISTIKQADSPVTEYYARIKSLWDELYQYKQLPVCRCGSCKCGVDKISMAQQNKEKPLQFLMGLDDHYEHVTNQILLMDPLPDVNKAFAQIGQVERKQIVNQSTKKNLIQKDSEVQEQMVMQVTSQPVGKNRFNGARNSKRNNNEKLFCKYCKKTNHTVDKCFKLVGYPADYEFTNKRQKQGGSNFNEKRGAYTANQVDASIQSQQSNSNQLSNDQCQQLITYLKCAWLIICKHHINSFVTLPNGTKHKVSHIGQMHDLITLKKIGMGVMHEGLYQLLEELKPEKKIDGLVNATLTDFVWHKRLGHPSPKVVMFVP